MGLLRGTRLDSCEILDLIGSGGMGEVYRGRDTKLGRDVAVKALPDGFVSDPERLARFEREAQALAALNHPNIAIIHDLKESNGAKYLILELVEGDTLAQRIARGPIPIEEALVIARQIASALEASHEKGIVHRDLKPANVKITPDGRVKVLDFGLAKIHESRLGSYDLSNSPTLASMHTGGGVIVGTAAYMSPEQARGKSVDRRADVWAFGCVLYEMLTARRTFPNGETAADTLAGILARDPDWQALPAGTPAKIRALLERCLRKDERQRLRDIGNARIQLEEAGNESAALAVAAAAPAPSRRREYALGALALASFLATVGIGASLLRQPTHAATVRFEVGEPDNLLANTGYVLSPDGRRLAFVTSTPPQIWVRLFEDPAPQAIPSTAGAGPNIFWSPDSQYIGFFAEGRVKKVPAIGGPAQPLGSLPPGGNYYGTWNAAGVILVGGDASPGGPLLRLSASGGEPKPVTEVDKARKESHRYPNFLPDGQHYVYLAVGGDGKDRTSYVGALDSKERQPLEGVAAEAKYADGHLVFIRDGALVARPFNARSLKFTGEPFPLADPFTAAAALTHPFSFSMTGSLAYRAIPGSAATGASITQLVWMDRNRNLLETPGPEAEYFLPELSPDGKSVSFARGSPRDIYVMDLATGRTDKVTDNPADDSNPRWSHDGKRLAFDSTRDGASNLYVREVGVTGAEDKLVLKGDSALSLSDWSQDGKYLLYVADGDIWAASLTGSEPKKIQVTRTPSTEKDPRFSPDGHWIAYVSNERAGQNQVYVQSFPDIPGIRHPVSTDGGVAPRWSRDGKELFYAAQPPEANPIFMAAPIKETGSDLAVGAAATLFNTGRASGSLNGILSQVRSYGVSSDGRFLVQFSPGTVSSFLRGGRGGRRGNQAGPDAGLTRGGITVILNWLGERGR